jgi:hypothetical protein
MRTVILDFEKRVKEIDLYFTHLEYIEEKDAQIFFPNKSRNKYIDYDIELTKVFKANLFLLLYNLAESSIKQSLNEIYDSITSENLKYKEVIDEIKKIWIEENHVNFRNKGVTNIFIAINNLAEDIIDIRFNSKVISGNIDGQKIRSFSSKYGFSNSSHHNANNGVKLLQVKTQRNNLAHGNISFAECGRNYTMSDLREIKRQVIIYLRSILKNIEKYINGKKFAI